MNVCIKVRGTVWIKEREKRMTWPENVVVIGSVEEEVAVDA